MRGHTWRGERGRGEGADAEALPHSLRESWAAAPAARRRRAEEEERSPRMAASGRRRSSGPRAPSSGVVDGRERRARLRVFST